MGKRPLEGVRVVDFGQGGAGPYCGQLLGDYGADVIKVEPPRGDWSRTMGAVEERTGLSGAYISMNRNKRGICLDLAMSHARFTALNLARQADVVLESFRPGVMDRLGLGFDQVRSINSTVIYCSINGFGSTGPNAHLPASDSVMQPYGGLMSIVGESNGHPLRVGNIVSDMLAGTNGFAAILLALLKKAAIGEGSRVEVSLLDSIIAFQTTGLTDYLITGAVPQPPGNRHPLLSTSGVVQAADGHVAFAVLDHYWDAFCDATGLVDLKTDSRFATSSARKRNKDKLWTRLEQAFFSRPVASWLDELTAIGIPCARVNDYASVAREPQVIHNRLFDQVAISEDASVPMVRSPMRIGTEEPRYVAPPRLGEHSREILSKELGMSAEEIDALIESGSVVAGT